MASLIVSRGFVVVASFAASVLWARTFDQDTFGKYQLMMAGTSVVGTFCLIGLNDATLISAAKKKDGNLSTILKLRLVGASVGGLLLVGWGVSRYSDEDTILMATFVIGGFLFIPLQLQPIWVAFTNGKRRFRLLTVGQIALAASGLVAIGAFWISGANAPEMLPWATLCTLGLNAVIGLYLHSTLQRETEHRDPTIIRYGHHVTLAQLLGFAFASDRLIVGEVLTDADVAVLAVALILPNQVKVLFTVFEQVFLPGVTEVPSIAAAWDYIKPRIARLWVVYVVLGIVGFVILPIVIPIFFSERYVDAVPYAKWLWLSLCISSAFTFFASILNSQRDKRFLYIKCIGNPAILLSLFVVLIPRYGLTGAVIARITNHVLVMIFHIVYFAFAVRASRRSGT